MTDPLAAYVVKARCENCRRRGRVRIPSGKRLDQARCPACKTLRLRLVLRVWPWNRGWRDQ